ncbi:MAG TPA: putative quinol monooxygenase [Mucilaginibacter sp.]
MNVNVIAIVTSRADTDATLQIELKKLVKATLSEPGCLSYEIYECDQQKGQYIITELWEDDEALTKHQKTPHYKYFVHIAPALLAQPVEIKTLTRLI